MFNDPELDALEEQVNVSNQNVAAALATFLGARAVVKQARSQYFPLVTTGPSVSRTQPASSGSQFSSSASTVNQVVTTPTVPTAVAAASNTSRPAFSAYSLPLDASWEPDLWGSVRNTVSADASAAQSSAATLENVRLTNQAELAVDYYELRGQDALKQVLDATVAALRKSLELTKTLYRTGIDSDADVALAETQLETVIAQDTALGIQRAQFEHAIAMLVGKPASEFSIPVRPLKTVPPAVPLGVPSDLLERRPDIAAAERSVAQANAQIGVARAAYYPAVTLSGTTGFQSSTAANLFTGPSFFWSVGASLAQTIFDAGRRAAVTEQAWANYQQTVANYRQTVLTGFQEVEDSLASSRILSQQLQQQAAAVKASQRSLGIATQRFVTGIDSYLNVITAQTTLLNNQQTEVNIQIQQMTASVQLVKALGGGWDASQLPSPKQILSKTPLSPPPSR